MGWRSRDAKSVLGLVYTPCAYKSIKMGNHNFGEYGDFWAFPNFLEEIDAPLTILVLLSPLTYKNVCNLWRAELSQFGRHELP